MTTVPPTTLPPAQPSAATPPSTLTNFEQQRRLNLLRIIVPMILGISLLSLPFSLYSDVNSTLANHRLSLYGSLEAASGLLPLALALWAVRQKRLNLAASMFFAGITINILIVISTDSFLPGPLALRSIPEFAMLIFPIAIAGLLGRPRYIVITTMGTTLFTLLMIALTRHDRALTNELRQPDGIVVYVIPLVIQLILGVLIYAASVGLRQAQSELNEVRMAYAREVELDRLKDLFIANVNHELRTPIMSLQGYITIARELGVRGEQEHQDQILARGMEALKSLATLVESVLKVREIEQATAAVALVPVEVSEAISQAVLLLDPRTINKSEHPLRIDLPVGLLVMADAERLRQVLLNLLANACKYCPTGTPIDITARSLPPQGQSKDALPPLVEIAVRDFGPGIPPAHIPLLFERFVRLERDISSPIIGTGLGLALCRAAITAMGGDIWLESTGVAGEGCTVKFVLALAEPTR